MPISYLSSSRLLHGQASGGIDQYAQNKDRFNRVLEACTTHSVSILVIPLVDFSIITNPQQVIDLQNLLSQFYGFMKRSGLKLH